MSVCPKARRAPFKALCHKQCLTYVHYRICIRCFFPCDSFTYIKYICPIYRTATCAINRRGKNSPRFCKTGSKDYLPGSTYFPLSPYFYLQIGKSGRAFGWSSVASERSIDEPRDLFYRHRGLFQMWKRGENSRKKLSEIATSTFPWITSSKLREIPHVPSRISFPPLILFMMAGWGRRE